LEEWRTQWNVEVFFFFVGNNCFFFLLLLFCCRNGIEAVCKTWKVILRICERFEISWLFLQGLIFVFVIFEFHFFRTKKDCGRTSDALRVWSEAVELFENCVGSSAPEIERIMEEIEEIVFPDVTETQTQEEQVQRECLICFDEEASVGFLHNETLHSGFCESCANTLMHQSSLCPLCNQQIERIIKVF
jgi:hypothetical protein